MLVYLAGPIDAVNPREARTWREWIKIGMPTSWVAFDPHAAFYSPNSSLETIDDVTAVRISNLNRFMIQTSDLMLVNLNGPAFGTYREIEVARHHRVPVLVVGVTSRRGIEQRDLLFADTIPDALNWMYEWDRHKGGGER